MSGGEDPYDDVVRAAYAFADQTYARLARRIVHAMQRFPASGIFDGEPHRTLWDEYCHERHFGPHEALGSIWDETVDPYVDHALTTLAPYEVDLLHSLADVERGRTASDELRSALEQCAMDRTFPPRYWRPTNG